MIEQALDVPLEREVKSTPVLPFCFMISIVSPDVAIKRPRNIFSVFGAYYTYYKMDGYMEELAMPRYTRLTYRLELSPIFKQLAMASITAYVKHFGIALAFYIPLVTPMNGLLYNQEVNLRCDTYDTLHLHVVSSTWFRFI